MFSRDVTVMLNSRNFCLFTHRKAMSLFASELRVRPHRTCHSARVTHAERSGIPYGGKGSAIGIHLVMRLEGYARIIFEERGISQKRLLFDGIAEWWRIPHDLVARSQICRHYIVFLGFSCLPALI